MRAHDNHVVRAVIHHARCPMSHSRRQLSFLALTVLGGALCLEVKPATVMAQKADARSQLLVSPAWLAQHIKDPNLVVLQAGDAEQYLDEHIPGARYASLDAMSRPQTRSDTTLS